MSKLRKAAEQARAALANARDYIYLLETGDVSWSEESQLQEIKAAIFALKKALAEPEQPHDLLCICGAEWDIYSDGREKLVAAPTPRKPLTDEEIDRVTLQQWGEIWGAPLIAHRAYARAIEKAHGIGDQHE